MTRDHLLGTGAWPREPFFIYLASGLGRDLPFQSSFLYLGVAFVLKKVHSWVSALFRDTLHLWTLPPHSLIQGHQFFLARHFAISHFPPKPTLPFPTHPGVPEDLAPALLSFILVVLLVEVQLARREETI